MNQILFCVFVVVFAGCQTQPPRYVITEGSASVRVPIDELVVSVSVETKAKTLAQASDINRALVLKTFDVYKQFGISDSDFVTQSSSAAMEDSYRNDSQVPKVSYSGHLTLRDPTMYDAIFKALTDLGRVEVFISSYSNRQVASYRAQAYRDAFASAKKEADLLVAGSDAKVGRTLKILKEGNDPFDRYDNLEKEIERASSAPAAAFVGNEERKVEKTFRRKYFDVDASVTVMFEIQ